MANTSNFAAKECPDCPPGLMAVQLERTVGKKQNVVQTVRVEFDPTDPASVTAAADQMIFADNSARPKDQRIQL